MSSAPAKKLRKSKTLWINLVISAAAFFPTVQIWIQENPTQVVAGLGLVNYLLRLATKGRVSMYAE